MKTSKKNYLVNLWGLGDLIATLSAVKKVRHESFLLITALDSNSVIELIESFSLEKNLKVISLKSRIKIFFFLSFLVMKKERIIFTSPLGGKSRSLAKIFSYFSSKVILAKEQGNIYEVNKKLFSKIFLK